MILQLLLRLLARVQLLLLVFDFLQELLIFFLTLLEGQQELLVERLQLLVLFLLVVEHCIMFLLEYLKLLLSVFLRFQGGLNLILKLLKSLLKDAYGLVLDLDIVGK